MLIALPLVPSTRPGPLQRLECLLNEWMNNKARTEPVTSHLMLTFPSTLARAIVSFSLKSPCPRQSQAWGGLLGEHGSLSDYVLYLNSASSFTSGCLQLGWE